MPEKFEEQYADVLQNIEFALVQVYNAHDEMMDFDAREAVNGLIRTYKAQARGRGEPALRLNAFQQEAYVRVKAMCEWRMGRSEGKWEDEGGKPVDLPMTPKTVDEIIACLQRILRSIEMWNREGGRRGYYEFVREFVR